MLEIMIAYLVDINVIWSFLEVNNVLGLVLVYEIVCKIDSSWHQSASQCVFGARAITSFSGYRGHTYITHFIRMFDMSKYLGLLYDPNLRKRLCAQNPLP
jgi:hypothetical protein